MATVHTEATVFPTPEEVGLLTLYGSDVGDLGEQAAAHYRNVCDTDEALKARMRGVARRIGSCGLTATTITVEGSQTPRITFTCARDHCPRVSYPILAAALAQENIKARTTG